MQRDVKGDSTSENRGQKGQGERQPWLSKMFRSRNAPDKLRDTIEELIKQEDSTEGESTEEVVLLKNVLSIRNVTVDDVMVPRADIVAIPAETPFDELAALVRESGHSRLPVYNERLDDAVGLVHIKDVLAGLNGGRSGGISEIMRNLLFVAPSMPVLELLLEMRAKRIHMALVVDEFGGVDGLVTIEDLVEEIVGEIEDEHDDESRPRLVRHRDRAIDIDARLEIEEFEAEAGSFLTKDERDEDIHTMGGLVFYLAGRVPRPNEIIRHESGIEFQIIDADARRIRRIRASGGALQGGDG